MSACEKCWGEAFFRSRLTGRLQADVYRELLAENEQAHTTTTERVNVVLNRGIDRRTATGTVTVFREVLCRANNNNCPTDWRDHSCTTIIHFQGHRINDPDIERQK